MASRIQRDVSSIPTRSFSTSLVVANVSTTMFQGMATEEYLLKLGVGIEEPSQSEMLCFQCSDMLKICDGVTFLFYPGLTHMYMFVYSTELVFIAPKHLHACKNYSVAYFDHVTAFKAPYL